MKVVIQKVKRASVTVDKKVVSQIEKGLCLLVGVSVEDTKEDADRLANKVLKVRLFEEDDKMWQKSVLDVKGEILSVSQFTLCGSVKKTRPDFHKAQKGPLAKELYDYFLLKLQEQLGQASVKDGIFGAMMEVCIVNDGPVTIEWDTK